MEKKKIGIWILYQEPIPNLEKVSINTPMARYSDLAEPKCAFCFLCVCF